MGSGKEKAAQRRILLRSFPLIVKGVNHHQDKGECKQDLTLGGGQGELGKKGGGTKQAEKDCFWGWYHHKT